MMQKEEDEVYKYIALVKCNSEEKICIIVIIRGGGTIFT